MEITWTDADSFKVLRHPVPGSFGIHSMRAVCTAAENGPPEPGTTYVAFNVSHTTLLVLYVRKDGRSDITKAYSGKAHQFDISKVINSRGRLCDNALPALQALLRAVL